MRMSSFVLLFVCLKLNLVRLLFLSFSLFLARCAHFVIALFGFPWNVGVDNFGSVEAATHNRAHKAREIICCARRGWNCNQLNQSNFICIGQVCKEKCPKRLHIIYKCRPLEPQSGWGKTSKILNREKRRNLRHRSDPSFLDGQTCSGYHGCPSITTARQRGVAHTMEEIIYPKPCLSPMHEKPRMSLLANYAAYKQAGLEEPQSLTTHTRQPIWFLVCLFRQLNCATFD